MRYVLQIACAGAAAMTLAACGVGGGHAGGVSTVLPHATTAPVASGPLQSAHVRITIPASSHTTSGARKPAYVSPATQSITVQVDVGSPVAQNLTPTSPNCASAGANFPLNCTVTVQANPGRHKVSFITYDQLNGAGNALSANVVGADFIVGQNPDIPVVLGGIPAALQIVASPGSASTLSGDVIKGFQFGSSSTQSMIIYTADAAGNFIVGPGSPTLAVSVVGASAGSGISVTGPGSSNPNEFAVSGAAVGTATLAIIATPAAGSTDAPLTANVALTDVSYTRTVGTVQYDVPFGIAWNSADGNLYVVDGQSNYGGECGIHQLTVAGVDTLIAGSPYAIPTAPCGYADGPVGTSLFNQPNSIAYNSATGNLYVTDTEGGNCAIREVTPAGVTTTIAGGSPANPQCGYADGIGSAALFGNSLSAIAYDSVNSNLYVTDVANCSIRQLARANNTWTVTTIAGTGPTGCTTTPADGPKGVSQLSYFTFAIAFDSKDGNLYVVDSVNTIGNIRQVTLGGSIKTIAGAPSGTGNNCGRDCYADGPGNQARFQDPLGLAYDANLDSLILPDQYNGSVRRVSVASGTMGYTTTIAGPPPPTTVTPPQEVDGPGPLARFALPEGAAYDPVHNKAYITEQATGRQSTGVKPDVREVSL